MKNSHAWQSYEYGKTGEQALFVVVECTDRTGMYLELIKQKNRADSKLPLCFQERVSSWLIVQIYFLSNILNSKWVSMHRFIQRCLYVFLQKCTCNCLHVLTCMHIVASVKPSVQVRARHDLLSSERWNSNRCHLLVPTSVDEWFNEGRPCVIMSMW